MSNHSLTSLTTQSRKSKKGFLNALMENNKQIYIYIYLLYHFAHNTMTEAYCVQFQFKN